MRLTVVGCTGSMPGPDSPASCYLVEEDGYRLLLDLGNGSLGALMRVVDLADVDAVAVTHLHADHCLDLTALYVARKWGPYGTGRRLPVVGPRGTADRLADAYAMRRDPGMRDTYDFAEVAMTVELGPFRLRTARMAHPVEAYAIRLDSTTGSLVYSGDTGPTDALPALAEGAELLLCEASFVEGEQNDTDLHLTGAEAGRAAQQAGVGQLVVTHVPPWNDVGVAVGEARSQFSGPVVAAAPGLTVDVAR